ncbi:hypothetical protein CONCODRAFT_169205 [Conidiobolus coronatus NRRL 28638]|uniref:F-box domain-containing protein n=1 Tax=Conidiobolus coronatus (strain ATCC 28846 / CBS 209.66 / NRRL 28638) TaxID=796925 RepID=A0A137NSA8_CONC2|nr:hypothetical protein CONCODRAFT_169205 [Conidiobolus coronatus NRRL 28638]|eukprot:KXN65628.1 hypothetical protein CONCODRAFT_169205 [Conidiobolus coronatus NRRL 28638]
MNNIDKINIKRFIGGIDWATMPVLNDIAVYLNRSDIIELSRACKYLRDYCKVNNVKLDIRNLRNLICTQMIDDLGSKSKLVKKVVLTNLITTKFANLFFKKFNYCKTVIINLYSILKHLNFLEIFFMEGLCDRDPKSILPPPNFKLPKTLKSITAYSYVLQNSFIPAINEINFATHSNIVQWKISGRYDTERFSDQQPNIVHLYLHDVPAIKFDKFKTILVNNPQLRTLAYELEEYSIEKLNTVLTLPNLQKLLLFNYSTNISNFVSSSLKTNTTIKTLILRCIRPPIIIEELLAKIKSLEDVIFIWWIKSSISAINWLQFKGKFNTITFGNSPYTQSELENIVDCLKPETKIIFDYTVKNVVNYDLTI